MQTKTKKVISTMIVVVLLFSGVAAITPGAQAASSVVVTSEAALLSAISTAPTDGTERTIYVAADIQLHSEPRIADNRNIIITSQGERRTLTTIWSERERHHIRIFNADLTINNIAFCGNRLEEFRGGGVDVRSNSTFTMNNNALIWNVNGNGIRVDNSSTFIMNGGEIKNNYGHRLAVGDYAFSTSAPAIYSRGRFYMNGGSVSENNGSAVFSGGSGGMFVMNGGEISNNVTGAASAGVRLSFGRFYMNGGNISGNSAMYNGGGVEVMHSSTFTMMGGEISNNVTIEGNISGVWVRDESAFTMYGGTISGNSAAGNGGGVSVWSNGTFTMNGGEILNNNASGGDGGGVRLSGNGARFYMNNGIIKNNTAGTNGGGVSFAGNGEHFYMNDGTISGNSAGSSGGGVSLRTAGTFIMSDGTISENSAGTNGGGVRLSGNSARFYMYGGSISGNSTRLAGGGVSLAGSSERFYMNDGTISENSAGSDGGGVSLFGSHSAITTSRGTISSGTINNNVAERNGGGVFIGNSWSWAVAPGAFSLYSGEITNNTAGQNGGGVFSSTASHISTLPVTAYQDLYISYAVNFSGNRAALSSPPPTNPEILTNIQTAPRTTSLGANTWLLNNYDINYMNPTRTLTFNGNGGETATGDTIQELTVYTDTQGNMLSCNVFTRPGFTFNGWNTAADGSGDSFAAGDVFTMTPDFPTTFYAVWQANLNTITFHSIGGSGMMQNQQIRTGETAPLRANTFTKIGHSFAGWVTTPGGTVEYADGAQLTMGATDVTLYAIWQTNIYTVRFVDYDGREIVSRQVAFGNAAVPPATPTREGWTFTNWTEDFSNITGDLTVGAVYAPNLNTITFNPNGGVGTMANQQLHTGETATLRQNIFTKIGHTFIGWERVGSDDQYADGSTITMDTLGITLMAIWSPNEYDITFDPNGGEGFMPPIRHLTGWLVPSLPQNMFTRRGHTFVGWATAPDGAVVYADNAFFTVGINDVTLYAVWSTNVYTVRFVDYDGREIVSRQVAFGNAAVPPVTPTRAGWTFTNWTEDFSNITGNLTVKVVYAPNLNTLTFHANGGGCAPYTQQLYTDETGLLIANRFERYGYIFLGWSTTPDGTVEYTDETEFVMGVTNIDLYAVWQGLPAVIPPSTPEEPAQEIQGDEEPQSEDEKSQDENEEPQSEEEYQEYYAPSNDETTPPRSPQTNDSNSFPAGYMFLTIFALFLVCFLFRKHGKIESF